MSSAQQAKFDSASTTRNPTVHDVLGGNNVSCSGNSAHSNEQPQTKRQKMENIKNLATTTPVVTTLAAANKSIPQDMDPDEHLPSKIGSKGNNNHCHHLCSSLSSSANSISAPSSSNNSPTSTPSSSRTTSLSQLLNVQSYAAATVLPSNHAKTRMSTGAGCASKVLTSATNGSATNIDEVDRIMLPDLLPIPNDASGGNRGGESKLNRLTSDAYFSSDDTSSTAKDMREFESALTKQCLCGVSEHTLHKPFQSYFSKDTNGQRRIANLSEWPTKKLMQFLSNLQLLFDIYLKQNSKGFICCRIMDVCDTLIRNDNRLIDEIIVLANYDNAYVQFLAGRVLASFLVIAKQQMNDDWLTELVDNLSTGNQLTHVAVQKIHFSLDIIKRIVEWKDIDLHPLEDEIVDSSETTIGATTTATLSGETPVNFGAYGAGGYLHFQTQHPTLETNYFSVHFHSPDRDSEDGETDDDADNNDVVVDDERAAIHKRLRPASSGTSVVPPPVLVHAYDYTDRRQLTDATELPMYSRTDLPRSASRQTGSQSPSLLTGCHIVTLTDSESFDTTHLKCITIKILENVWANLVSNMSALIRNHLTIDNAEICIMNFLVLWENIISVKANLSIVETRPFYKQLEQMELLLHPQLSCTVYKQMLSLFNEVLCYGSTLALQDILPEETCRLAHQIVRSVKDGSIFAKLPRRHTENAVSFIGFTRTPVVYETGSLDASSYAPTALMTSPLAGSDVVEMDRTILQKMVLLVLKSIAVMVKEIRSDSSDSSVDSVDSDAYQDMVLIQRSIRYALQKLEAFIKPRLQFLPDCHFSKILIHLFDDQDDHLIEAMVCTLDVTTGFTFRNSALPDLVAMLNPVYTFLEFLKMTSNSTDLLLDLLVSNETCFLLYLLRFLKYIRTNWLIFVQSCNEFGGMNGSAGGNNSNNSLDEAMGVLIRLRLQISRLVSRQLYPYEISPVLRLLESCESLYEGSEL